MFQEWIGDRFWMLVACQLVNLTTWRQARPAFDHLTHVYEGANDLRFAGPGELMTPLRPLGMWRRRAVMLPRFAEAWTRGRPSTAEDVMKMPGCGRYAADSWAIFVEDRTDIEPNDGKLRWYLQRRQSSATRCAA